MNQSSAQEHESDKVLEHERSKHIDVAYHHIQNLHKKNKISVNFVSSQDMIADELIKSLSRQNFKRFIEQLKLKDSES